MAPKKKEEPVELIDIEDFTKIKLVVGEVLKCCPHPNANKLLVSQINIGSKTIQVVSGIADYYKTDEMVGKKVIVVSNLKPVTLRGVLSEGMILAGSNKKMLEVLSVEKLRAGDQIK